MRGRIRPHHQIGVEVDFPAVAIFVALQVQAGIIAAQFKRERTRQEKGQRYDVECSLSHVDRLAHRLIGGAVAAVGRADPPAFPPAINPVPVDRRVRPSNSGFADDCKPLLWSKYDVVDLAVCRREVDRLGVVMTFWALGLMGRKDNPAGVELRSIVSVVLELGRV